MAHYKYQSQAPGGEISTGVMAADSAIAAAQVLRSQGHQVLQLTPVSSLSHNLKDKFAALNQGSGPTQKDILNFTTQLAVMVRAGISLRAAIEGIADQTPSAKFKKILMQIKMDVESGKQFSEALVKHPKLFNPLYVNMVRASEMSGSFSKMLDRIAANLAQSIETRAMVIGALIYPGVIGGMAVSVTIFLLTFVLPRFTAVFKGKEHALPGPTKFLMGLSDFMVVYWWTVVIAIFAVIVGAVIANRTEPGARWFDMMKLKVPLFKKMYKALYISRSLHTMGELVNAGVPMLDTLLITGDISGNWFFKRLWRNVYTAVKEGKKIAHTLTRTALLPKAVVQMISAGEESGKLGEVLDEVSAFYAKQLREVIKTVTSMIEPIMIVLMGSVVGFIAMAIILPIFKMSAMVK